MINNNVQDKSVILKNVHTLILNSDASRSNIYKEINPNFIVHSIYTTRHAINDLYRIAFTRLRVSGHNLAIETGRWNRRGRGRLPVEERLCVCGVVQTEDHVVRECSRTQNIREQYGFSSMQELFGNFADGIMCEIAHKILATYM